jgi:putative ABC transport system substrate-binding protein
MPVIGFLSQEAASNSTVVVAPFVQGLKDSGFVDRQNVAIEYRFAEGQPERLPALASNLVSSRVALIVSSGNAATAAAKGATSTITIVFIVGSDPVELGFVASLNRPGGNITGFSSLQGLLVSKHLELLSELVPKARLIGCLVNPSNSNTEPVIEEARRVTQVMGKQIVVLNVGTDGELVEAFATLVQQRADAFLIGADPFFNRRMEKLSMLARLHALPAIYPLREYAAAGGLMSYGSSLAYELRQGGIYASRVLKGEKPADLPVEQATKIELVFNLKTAKALGLTIPETLLATADEVIQ